MRFIQVGVGGFGKGWLQRLAGHPAAEVAALVDVNPAALAAAREQWGYDADKCFTSLERALGRVAADALLCVTPPEYHRRCAVAAMRAGLDVLTEKPLAARPADCLAIAAAARETGRACVVSQNYRYRPETWTLARLVAAGRIGAVGQGRVEFFYGRDFGGGFRHEMDYPLLVDMAIHHFDLVRFITGLDAVSVRGEAWNPPWSNYRGACSSALVFEMENGARIAYNASWCSKGEHADWNGNWLLEGTRGALSAEKGVITLLEAPERYLVRRTEAIAAAGPEKLNQDHVLDDFIACRRRGEVPRTSVLDNLRSIAMVFAAVRAVRTGRRVPVLDGRVRELLSAPESRAG